MTFIRHVLALLDASGIAGYAGTRATAQICCRIIAIRPELPPPQRSNPCVIEFYVLKDIPAPSFFSYVIKNMHHNLREYVKSRSDMQLRVLTHAECSSVEPDPSEKITKCSALNTAMTEIVYQSEILMNANSVKGLHPSNPGKSADMLFGEEKLFNLRNTPQLEQLRMTSKTLWPGRSLD